MNPKARTQEICVEKMPDGLVVYDKQNSRVHRLNASAAAVWEQADGTRTKEQLAESLGERLGTASDSSLVTVAIKQLRTAGLLESPVAAESSDEALPSRRELGRKLASIGIAASALPMVASIAAPAAAKARSHASTSQSYTPQSYAADLGVVEKDIAHNLKKFEKSPAAQNEFSAGISEGSKGLAAYSKGKYGTSQADLQAAEKDLDSVLKILGID